MIGDAVVGQPVTVSANQPALLSLTDTCGNAREVLGFVGKTTIATPSLGMSQAWQVCAQYGGSRRVCKSVFGALTAPAPVVTVEECTASCNGGGTGGASTSASSSSSSSGSSGGTGGAPTCSRTIGAGTVTVQVASPGAAPTTATLFSQVDGVLQGSQTLMLPNPYFDFDGGEGGAAWVEGSTTVQVPSSGKVWLLTAQVGAYPTSAPPIRLVQPSVVAVGQLSQPSCGPPPQLCAGLGPASLEVEMQGTGTPENVALSWYPSSGALDGGVPVLDGGAPFPSTVVSLGAVADPVCGPVTGVAQLPVPTIPGSDWEIWWQFGTAPPQKLLGPVTVSAPVPTAVVEECGASCNQPTCTRTIGAGTVTVDVSSPGSVPTTATLLSSVDGVLQSNPATVMLSTPSFGAGTPQMQGSTTVTVPASGSTWTLTPEVGGYVGTPVSIQLAQPNVVLLGGPSQPACGSPPALCAGLGPASIDIEMTGTGTPESVVLSWYLDPGQALDGGVPVLDAGTPFPSQVVNLGVVSDPVCGPVSGSAFLPVPSLPGTDWEIWWQTGTAAPQKLLGPITILPAPITVQLACDGSYVQGDPGGAGGCGTWVKCGTPPDGGVSDLLITAPATLAGQAVSVETIAAGVPSSSAGGTLTLNVATQQAEAHVGVPLPASGAFEVVSTVGSFSVSSCFTF
jgi:hypothetical protein